MVFTPTQRNQNISETKARNDKKETAHSASPPRNAETTSVVFLLCRCIVVLVSVVFLVVLVVFAAVVFLVVPFVFAALVVCAAGAVLQVVVATLAIKQGNKKAS